MVKNDVKNNEKNDGNNDDNNAFGSKREASYLPPAKFMHNFFHSFMFF
jgi:hypothetical protein